LPAFRLMFFSSFFFFLHFGYVPIFLRSGFSPLSFPPYFPFSPLFRVDFCEHPFFLSVRFFSNVSSFFASLACTRSDLFDHRHALLLCCDLSPSRRPPKSPPFFLLPFSAPPCDPHQLFFFFPTALSHRRCLSTALPTGRTRSPLGSFFPTPVLLILQVHQRTFIGPFS